MFWKCDIFSQCRYSEVLIGHVLCKLLIIERHCWGEGCCICIYNPICSLKEWFWIRFCTADLHRILGCLLYHRMCYQIWNLEPSVTRLQPYSTGIKYVMLSELATRKQNNHKAYLNPEFHPVEGNGTHKCNVACYIKHIKQLRPVNPSKVCNII